MGTIAGLRSGWIITTALVWLADVEIHDHRTTLYQAVVVADECGVRQSRLVGDVSQTLTILGRTNSSFISLRR